MALDEVLGAIRRKIIAGNSAAASEGAEIYREEVTATTETPVIGPQGGISFPGPHSSPGQYPHKETGQGEANIDSEDNEELLESYFGLRGEATGFGPFEPTHQIAGGIHLEVLNQRGWKGADDVLAENIERIADAYQRAAEATD